MVEEIAGLDFERPVLEMKIRELRNIAITEKMDFSEEINILEEKCNKMKLEIFGSLTAWQKVQLARHPRRPYTMDYIRLLSKDFLEIHGDRAFGDDLSIIGGLATFEDEPIMIIGHQKGRTVQENMQRNFGMPHPEGYRKAERLMRLAEKFKIPLVTLIDTPGAYPGIGAEERGQAEAIGRNLWVMAQLKIPFIALVIGEGGSGGALALALADRVLMLENSIYSVITPEGCAAILFRDAGKSGDAAKALKLTSNDLLGLKVIDEIVPEPLGGAHCDVEFTAEAVRQVLKKSLQELRKNTIEELVELRYQKFRKMGVFK